MSLNINYKNRFDPNTMNSYIHNYFAISQIVNRSMVAKNQSLISNTSYRPHKQIMDISKSVINIKRRAMRS